MVVWENAATPRMGQDEKGKDGRRSCSSNISDQLEGRRPDEPAYRAVINYKTSLMADLRLEFGYFLFLRERHYGKGQLSNQIPQSTIHRHKARELLAVPETGPNSNFRRKYHVHIDQQYVDIDTTKKNKTNEEMSQVVGGQRIKNNTHAR